LEVVEKFSEMTNVARQFIEKRPNTSLFVGLLLVSSCIPVAIFLAIVVGFFLVMLTGLLVIQGTIIGLGLTTLLVILPGPLCFATFCTLLAYVAQCVFVKLKPVCKTSVGDLMNRIEMVSAGLPTWQGRSLSENVMVFMSRGNVEDSSIDMDDTMSTDDEYGETSSKQPGLQARDGRDVFNRLVFLMNCKTVAAGYNRCRGGVITH
jgi:hypothetical protein